MLDYALFPTSALALAAAIPALCGQSVDDHLPQARRIVRAGYWGGERTLPGRT